MTAAAQRSSAPPTAPGRAGGAGNLTAGDAALLGRFEALEIDPGEFGHREHVAAACAMLRRYPFVEAAARYARTIRTMAERAGASQKFNVTVTLAFMDIIAERIQRGGFADCESFLARNPDLLDKNLLGQWYSPERLRSPQARSAFLMPDLRPRPQ